MFMSGLVGLEDKPLSSDLKLSDVSASRRKSFVPIFPTYCLGMGRKALVVLDVIDFKIVVSMLTAYWNHF